MKLKNQDAFVEAEIGRLRFAPTAADNVLMNPGNKERILNARRWRER